ncbi:hypothetical protein [Mycolicibacterium parafortuitum]|uniref:hypothetical protein n=1 Tax=Mycolicibacterium parafortuitum TaxID=39692 RepID=UPI00105636ED|nr:hypothetical protein [Mycolicibacterium parafortuitum]
MGNQLAVKQLYTGKSANKAIGQSLLAETESYLRSGSPELLDDRVPLVFYAFPSRQYHIRDFWND